MTHVFAVVNQKGGTAKTTTAVAIASKLALIGKRVLLMDITGQPDMAAMCCRYFVAMFRRTALPYQERKSRL